MKKFLNLIVLLFLAGEMALLDPSGLSLAGTKTINGAGASFPFPVYSKWAYFYNREMGVRINYQSIGSGGGIRQIKAKAVDFGASDAPLKAEELNESGLIQFPMVIGGVVPVVNIQGVGPGDLKLTPDLLSDIFAGKIRQWNDDRIAGINPGIKLPGRDINVVHRADGSGTTWIFTNYLDKVSPWWHGKVGFGKAVDWPVGMGGKGNEGVAAYVKHIDGAIGYVEYAYALQSRMSHVLLQNREKQFVAPTSRTFQAAASNADWRDAPGYYLILTDQPGKGSWPITGASFILLFKEQEDPEKARAMLEFFDWCFKHGQKQAEELYYIPMPDSVIEMIEKTWASEIESGGKAVW